MSGFGLFKLKEVSAAPISIGQRIFQEYQQQRREREERDTAVSATAANSASGPAAASSASGPAAASSASGPAAAAFVVPAAAAAAVAAPEQPAAPPPSAALPAAAQPAHQDLFSLPPAPSDDFRQTLDKLSAQAVGPAFVRVKASQKGNPVLKHIKRVPWQFCEQVPDYLVGKSTCVLYLSLKYHNLHETYIDRRIRELGRLYRLRILLALVDTLDNEATVIELSRLSVMHDMTLVLAWSEKEAGRYIETFKAMEHKPADALRPQAPTTFVAQMEAALTSVHKINRSDTITLVSTFGSFRSIAKASVDELALCPGFGENKIHRLQSVLSQPFVNPERKRPSRFRLEAKIPDRGGAGVGAGEGREEDFGRATDGSAAEKRRKEGQAEDGERQEQGGQAAPVADEDMPSEEDIQQALAMKPTQEEMAAEGEHVLMVDDEDEDEDGGV